LAADEPLARSAIEELRAAHAPLLKTLQSQFLRATA
jgi:hypothetical protein